MRKRISATSDCSARLRVATNCWKNSAKKPVANRELWEELLDVVENGGHTISFEKVKGHANLLGRASSDEERHNQRCDELAVAACPALP